MQYRKNSQQSLSDAERYPGGNGITSGSTSYHTSSKILTHDRMNRETEVRGVHNS
jgi:hypothetical protein